MKILITGKNGVIGSKLYDFLGQMYKIYWIEHNNIDVCYTSTCNGYIDVLDICDIKIDYFIHCATLKQGVDSDVFYSNLIYPVKIVEKLSENVKIINIDTTSYFYRVNSYGLSKKFFKEFLEKSNLSFKNLYIEHIVARKTFLEEIIKRMLLNKEINLSEGSQIRNFISIDDIVCMINVVVLHFNKIKDKKIGLFSDDYLSIKDIVLKLKQLTDSKSQLNFGKICVGTQEYRNIYFDNRIFKEYGWRQKSSIEVSLKKLIEEIKDEISFK